MELQYRGRVRELKKLIPVRDGDSDLFKAMMQIAKTNKGPENQIPSAGCGRGKTNCVSYCNKIIPTRIGWNAKFDVGLSREMSKNFMIKVFELPR